MSDSTGGVSRSELKEAALEGARWGTVARACAELAGLGSAVVLARLIPPAEFGHAALAIVVTTLALAVADQGIGAPLIQRRDVLAGHAEAAMLLSVLVGVVLSVATFVLAPVVCDPLFGERTGELVRLVSPVWVVYAVGAIPKALLNRRLAFRRLSVVDVVALVVGTVVALACGLGGLDGSAIVLGALATALVSTAGLLMSHPFVMPRWDRAAAASNARFGVPTALSSLTHVAQRNVDYAIVGAALGPTALGFYWRAFQLGADYQSKISRIMLRVAFPLLSRAGSSEDMHAVRMRMVRVHAVVIFPLIALYVAVAPEVVPWLFGSVWEPVVEPSQWLAVAGLTYAVSAGTGALVLAAGHPRALLVNNVVLLLVYAGVVFVFAPSGLVTVSIAVAAFNVVAMVATYWFLVDRLVGIPIAQLWSDLMPAIVGSLTLLAIVVPLVSVLGSAPVLVLLAVCAVAGGAAYLLCLRLLFGREWTDLSLLARSMTGRRRAAATAQASRAAA